MKCKILKGLFIALVFLSSSSVTADKKNYSFGVFPYLPPTKLTNLFSPISRNFEEALDAKIEFRTKGNYSSFTKELEAETYDIAFVQPFDYVNAHDNHNYLPLARRGGALKAIIVVDEKSPITSLKSLKNKIISNPPKVAAVSHLTSMALQKAGLDPDKDVERAYGKSHFSCMQQVLIGKADACGTAMQALAHFEKKHMNERLRIIAESESIPHSLFVVHKRVPQVDREKLKNRILNWQNTTEGKNLLANGKFIPFIPAEDEQYDIVRKYKSERPD
jgi:phosphonate transport system substrate-binding protein